jgi:hypothetical protein
MQVKSLLSGFRLPGAPGLALVAIGFAVSAHASASVDVAAPAWEAVPAAAATDDAFADAFAEELEDHYAAVAQAAADPASPSLSTSDTSAGAAAPATEPLLPDQLGPIETVFWGHHGLMRGIGFPLTEESREKELSLRRGMLTLHQVGGFLTLAAMAATVYTGQMIVNGEDGLYNRKKILAKTTIAAYFTTAGLALLSPPPMIKRKQFSSITVHKALGVVHFTGMVIMPILGQMLVDGKDYEATLRYHQTIGYITFAALAGAMIVVTF